MTEKEIAEQRSHFRISHEFGEWNVYGRTRTVAIHNFKTKVEAEALCDRLARIPKSPEMNSREIVEALGEKWCDEL